MVCEPCSAEQVTCASAPTDHFFTHSPSSRYASSASLPDSQSSQWPAGPSEGIALGLKGGTPSGRYGP